ncbi:MAG: hypothetical protein FKGGLIKP_00856 [Sodalis sp. Fse]|nr:MAG: hypothetical protein FKGGLIKP_00856 [Sodalis sp. Fse]
MNLGNGGDIKFQQLTPVTKYTTILKRGACSDTPSLVSWLLWQNAMLGLMRAYKQKGIPMSRSTGYQYSILRQTEQLMII